MRLSPKITAIFQVRQLKRTQGRYQSLVYQNRYLTHSGYYDWGNPNSYQQALSDEYVLNDIVDGYRFLRDSKPSTHLYSAEEMHFVIYVYLLYPVNNESVLEDFMQHFIRREQAEKSDPHFPYYLFVAKQLLQLRFVTDPVKTVIIEALRSRLENENNLLSLQKMNSTLSHLSYHEFKDSFQFFGKFKALLHNTLAAQSLTLSSAQTHQTISILETLCFMENSLRSASLLSELPSFEDSQLLLQNLLTLLPSLLTPGFLQRINHSDLALLNQRIAKCTWMQQKKTKQLLDNYAEHLAIVGALKTINMQGLLDPV